MSSADVSVPPTTLELFRSLKGAVIVLWGWVGKGVTLEQTVPQNKVDQANCLVDVWQLLKKMEEINSKIPRNHHFGAYLRGKLLFVLLNLKHSQDQGVGPADLFNDLVEIHNEMVKLF